MGYRIARSKHGTICIGKFRNSLESVRRGCGNVGCNVRLRQCSGMSPDVSVRRSRSPSWILVSPPVASEAAPVGSVGVDLVERGRAADSGAGEMTSAITYEHDPVAVGRPRRASGAPHEQVSTPPVSTGNPDVGGSGKAVSTRRGGVQVALERDPRAVGRPGRSLVVSDRFGGLISRRADPPFASTT